MKNINELIKLLCDTKEQREGSILHRGSILNINICGDGQDFLNILNKIEGFTDIEGGNYYSFALKNDELLTLTTYCEGDVTFEVCDNKKVYNSKVKDYTEFYTDM